MLIVFGSIYHETLFIADEGFGQEQRIEASHSLYGPGGRGALQAFMASRNEANTYLVGKAGDDSLANEVLVKLKRQGVAITGVAKSEKLQTGMRMRVLDKSGKEQVVIRKGANEEATADQVSSDLMAEKAMLLLQTEIKPEENAEILAKAKERGMTTFMNLAPDINIKKKELNNLDYLIVNHREAETLAQSMGIHADDEALTIAKGLADQGGVNCIITLGEHGAIAVTKEGKAWQAPALKLEEVVDHAGAEDAYVGTFAACIYADMPLPRAMKRASVAGSLTCMKHGTYHAFPLSGEIDDRMTELDEPMQVDI